MEAYYVSVVNSTPGGGRMRLSSLYATAALAVAARAVITAAPNWDCGGVLSDPRIEYLAEVPADQEFFVHKSGPAEIETMGALIQSLGRFQRSVSIDEALRSHRVPAAVKLAYLDATRSLTADQIAAYRALAAA